MNAKLRVQSLETLAIILNENTNNTFEVKTIWLDFGAGIKGDNIINVTPDRTSYQVLNFRELDEIIMGYYTMDDAQELVQKIRKRGWYCIS